MEAGVATRSEGATAPRTVSARGVLDRLRGASPATLLFAAAVLASAVWLLHWLSETTFWRDEWMFILDRQGHDLDTYLDPWVEQLLAIPIAIYQLLIAVFGIDSPTPFQITTTATFLLSIVLLFVYVRRRVGEWLALALTLPILFLGPAWDHLLVPFQFSFSGSVVLGLGALLALDREDRRGDIVATVLLVGSLFFSQVGIPFVAAATIDIALTRERFRRAFVVVIPTLCWLAWYAGWGRHADNFISLHNFTTLPGYVPDGFSSSLAAFFGLSVPRDEAVITPLDWGRPLFAVAVAFVVWRIATVGVRALPRRLWGVLFMNVLLWSLTGLNASFFGQAVSGRYQYMGTVFLVLLAAELLRGVVLSRRALIAVFAVVGVATLANFSQLREMAAGLADIGKQERGGLAALELTRGVVAPDFVLTEKNSGVDYLGLVDAGSYFSAIDSYGSPAYTSAELAAAPEVGRVAADKVFAAALGLAPARAGESAGGPCVTAAPGAPVELSPGGALLRAESGTPRVHLRRYATESFPVDAGRVSGSGRVSLAIPEDGSTEPWELEPSGGTALVCGLEAGG